MVRWHHQINGHEFEQILEDSEEHGMLQSMGSQRDNDFYCTQLAETIKLGLSCPD